MGLLDMVLAGKLVDTATIYAPDDAANGAYTVVVASGVACRLDALAPSGVRDAPRAVLLGQRRLLFDATAPLTEHHQVEIAGSRWNVETGSVEPQRDLVGGIAIGACLVNPAETG